MRLESDLGASARVRLGEGLRPAPRAQITAQDRRLGRRGERGAEQHDAEIGVEADGGSRRLDGA